MNDLAGDQLVVGPGHAELRGADGPGQRRRRRRRRPTRTTTSSGRARRFSTTSGGRRLHAWSKLNAADETWIVASSASYDLVAGQIQRSAMSQLALTAALLVAVPIAGLLRGAARAARAGRTAPARTAARRVAEDGSDRQAGRRRRARLQQHADRDPRLRQHDPRGRAAEVADPASRRCRFARAAESAATLTQKLLAFSRGRCCRPTSSIWRRCSTTWCR